MQHAGVPTAETPAPSSHNTSITEAVMSLPDLLRARSAQLVGALELGAPLGRGQLRQGVQGCADAHNLRFVRKPHLGPLMDAAPVCAVRHPPDLSKLAWDGGK